MFRRAGILVFALILSQFSPGAFPARTPPRYVNKDYHFSFMPPAGWKEITNANFHAYRDPQEKNASVILTIRFTDSPDLESFRKEALAHNPEMRAHPPQPAKLGGLPAYIWQNEFRNDPKSPVVAFKEIFCVRDKRAFVLVFTAPKAKSARYQPLFHKLLASFHWDP